MDAHGPRPWDARRLLGPGLSGLTVALLAADAAGKLLVPDVMIANTPPLGLPADPGFYRLLGAILAIGVALYTLPRTAFLGAVLLTGYLGGAVAIHLRVGDPLFGATLFGVYLGLMAWGGLWLRDPRLRALLPRARLTARNHEEVPPVSRMIFINLPVTNLERSRRFYEAIGARNEPKFSNERGAMMRFSDQIAVMLLSRRLLSHLHQQADRRRSPGPAPRCCASAATAQGRWTPWSTPPPPTGGKADPGPKQDLSGMMYGRSFEDPDGHHWEPMWMDPSAAAEGASAMEKA